MKNKYFFILFCTVFFTQKMNAQLTLLNENFSTCNGVLPAGWQQYSVTGSDSWKCTVTGFTDKGVYMNGYSGGNNNNNEDWLISPSLDLSSYSEPNLYFWSRTKFNGNPIEIRVSSNYAGSGNPNLGTWTALPAALPAVNSDVWQHTANVDLTLYKNQPFYIACKYTSNVNAAALWRLDDLQIFENALSLSKKFINTGQCAAGSWSAGQSFQFTMNGLSGTLTLNAPSPFQISKDNVTFASQLTYNAAASGIPQTVYARISPTVTEKVYHDSLLFTYNGHPVKEKVLVLGTSLPDDRTLRVVNWNMRWFGEPVMCNCDTALAKSNAILVFKDLNADIYCLQEMVNVSQLNSLTAALGPAYQSAVSTFCSGVTNANDPYYGTCQKLAYIYNTQKIQNLGTFGLLASTYPSDTMPYYCFGAGRFPFVMKAKILLANGASDTVLFVNLHGKAYDAQQDYNRRLCAAQNMTDSLNALFPNKKIMVIGDYNDFLEGSTVTGNINSPYKYLLDNGFTGITLPSKYPGQSTYAWSTDYIIDNIACKPDLYNQYIDSSFFIFNEAGQYISDYANTTSDHYACMSYYKFNFPNTLEDQHQQARAFNFTIQNPSAETLTIFRHGS
ncbi:MAG: choice-of-anchor J domain-containing protein, partial [Chitinophagaceae bacterium]|nr:choice-of-anchor J domain-containing protein [Chitinophagaceae bacterium]